MPINLNANTMSQLRDLAAISYGHGSTKAGAGNMGMVNGQVVKFNTHFKERVFTSGPKAEMRASCDALREHLGGIVRDVYGQGQISEGLAKVLRQLGLDESGKSLPGEKGLLDRKIVAKFVDQIKQDGATAGLDGVRGVKTIKDTSFSEIKLRATASGQAAKLLTDFKCTKDGLSADDRQILLELLKGRSDRSYNLRSQLFGGFDNLSFQVLSGKKTLAKAKAEVTSRCTEVKENVLNDIFTNQLYIKTSVKKRFVGDGSKDPSPIRMIAEQVEIDMKECLERLVREQAEAEAAAKA